MRPHFKRGESFFRHASHYLNCLTRDQEAFSLVAKQLGDNDILNYEEIYSVAVALAHENWKNTKPQSLPQDAKISLAKILHYDYKIRSPRTSSTRVLACQRSQSARLASITTRVCEAG